MNPYLKRLREQYEALRASMEGIQTRAATDGRDLTDDELRSIEGQAEQAKALHKQIADLTEIETRNRQVTDLAATLDAAQDNDQAGEQVRAAGEQSRTLGASSTRAVDRDPGHYTRSSENSFFADLYRSRIFQDDNAARRLVEHNRALSTGTNGPGVVPPKWLTEEFETLARQGRAVANAVRNIPLGDDPRPMTLPKQTTGTDDVVAEQANENDPVAGTDAWDSDVDTVTPKPTSGKQTVSRQMVDMSSPAIDQLIYGDLIGVYNAKVEAKVAAAIAAVGTALAAEETGATVTVGLEDDAHFLNVTLDAAIAVRDSRKLAANIAAMSVGRYGKFLKLKDADGRPLIPNPGVGQAVNVAGVGSVAVDGIVHGLGIVASDGFVDDANFAVARASDVILFESNLLRFRFEEQAGPESIVLGIWGYTAALVRQGTKAVKRVAVTSA